MKIESVPFEVEDAGLTDALSTVFDTTRRVYPYMFCKTLWQLMGVPWEVGRFKLILSTESEPGFVPVNLQYQESYSNGRRMERAHIYWSYDNQFDNIESYCWRNLYDNISDTIIATPWLMEILKDQIKHKFYISLVKLT